MVDNLTPAGSAAGEETSPGGGVVPAAGRRRWLPGPQGLVLVVAAVAGARLGLRPISDNSTLVHLRTGIDLVRTWHVPRSDPYSFTAAGHPWVVQSWFASLLNGLANEIGHHALVFEQGLIMAGVGAAIAMAARSTTAWRSGLAALLAIAASAPGWSPRPLMFELGCLALLIVVVERRASPLWLIPIMWVWVNTHGSWPVGLAWLGARGVGELIDRRGWPRQSLTAGAGFAAGLVVSLVNPLTWRLLTFPAIAIQKRAIFKGIVEWRSPDFQSPNSFLALIFITLALVVLLRAKLPWAQLLPVCGFLPLALISERNLAPFGVVLAPALAVALAGPPLHRPGGLVGWAATWWNQFEDLAEVVIRVSGSVIVRLAAVLAAVGVTVALVVLAVGRPTLRLTEYPVAATDFLQRTGRLTATHRIAAVDVIGCFLIWRAGPTVKVFIDDRYDMYPASVVSAAGTLAAGVGDGVEQVLDRYGVDTVLWSQAGVLPGTLLQLGGWRQAYSDGTWVVLERVPGSSA